MSPWGEMQRGEPGGEPPVDFLWIGRVRIPGAQARLEMYDRDLLVESSQAAAKTVVVSPCTTTASGFCSVSTACTPHSARVVISVSVCPGRWISRSASGFIPKTSLTWLSMDRCCAVTVTSGVKNADS